MVKETTQFFWKNLLKLFLILFGMAVLLTVVFYTIYSKNPADAVEEIQSLLRDLMRIVHMKVILLPPKVCQQ